MAVQKHQRFIFDLFQSIVMVTSGGRVCVTDICVDFNIREITEAGRTSIPANWQYKSPEVLLVTTNAGTAADVYSWGATVYEVRPNKTLFELKVMTTAQRYSLVIVLTMALVVLLE